MQLLSLKKFDFVLFSNDPRISDPNHEKRFNRVLNRYCNLNDIYHMIIAIDPLLEEAVVIKDIIHLFYKNINVGCGFVSTYSLLYVEIHSIRAGHG